MQREYEPLIQELFRLLREEFGDRERSLLVFGSVALVRRVRTAMSM